MPGMAMMLAFLSGSCVFSFLNVVVYRLPRRMDFVHERSRCENCGHVLSAVDLIPVFGWFLLRGKCRYCKAEIPVRYPLTEALGGLTALLCVQRWGISLQALTTYVFLGILTVVTFVDMDTKKIPDSLVLAAGMAGLLSIPFFPDPGLAERALGVFSVSLILLAAALIVPGGFGGGDIKLTAACGLFLGCRLCLISFVLAVLTAGGYCVLMLAAGRMKLRTRFAFGPFLCLGMGIALLCPGI